MAGYGVKKLILFGSRARNEATEDSDRNYPLVRFLRARCSRFEMAIDYQRVMKSAAHFGLLKSLKCASAFVIV